MIPHKILLVDDRKLERQNIKKILLNVFPKIKIREQHAPDLVLADIREFNPDLIIMGIFLTYSNGLNVLRVVRNSGNNTPVIFTTKVQGDYDDLICRIVPKNNVLGIIFKPVDEKKLSKIITKNNFFVKNKELV